MSLSARDATPGGGTEHTNREIIVNGPGHYREAERHLHHAARAAVVEPENESRHLGYAQVHATLALVAASAPTSSSTVALDRAWCAVTDVERDGAK